jgi:thiamine biosynthesis lipoprotein
MEFQALGTRCLVLYADPSDSNSVLFESAVQEWIVRFEARYSRFKPTSLVSRINDAAGLGWVAIDQEMEQMLDVCAQLYALTSGILDCTTGPLLRLWDYRRTHSTLPTDAQVAQCLTLVGWPQVQRRPGQVFLPHQGMMLDFGGWGKEWAVDAVTQLARQFGLDAVLVDFGHDVRGLGRPPGRTAWHLGVENPDRPGTHQGSIALTGDRGVASSGDYQRFFLHNGRRYSHIIDPRTGRPVSHGCRQFTVLADTCFQAGILSTTAFVLGPVAGLDFIQRFPGTEALMTSGSDRHQTRGWWKHAE